MLLSFFVKMVFFGAYVVVMVKVVGLRPIPFVTKLHGGIRLYRRRGDSAKLFSGAVK